MQIQQGDDQASEMRNEQLPSEEDITGTQTHKLTQRKHVDALLDISEDMFLRDQEPYEYYCYSAWEDAVCGWARAAPLSCILMSQKSHRKTKHKDAEAPIPSSVHQTSSREECSADLRDKRLHNLQKTLLLYPQINFGSHASEGTDLIDATKRFYLNAPQRNLNYFFAKKKLEEERILQESCLRPDQWPSNCFIFKKRPAKLRRHNQRPKNIAIPIKTFTFLPAIEPPHINHNVQCHECRNSNVPEKHNFYDKMFVFDTKNETKVIRTDTVTKSELYNVALISKDKTRQHGPYLFSALSGSFPKKYQTPVSQS